MSAYCQMDDPEFFKNFDLTLDFPLDTKSSEKAQKLPVLMFMDSVKDEDLFSVEFETKDLDLNLGKIMEESEKESSPMCTFVCDTESKC